MKRKLGWFGLGFAGAELAAAILPPLVCVPAAAFLVCLALLWIKRRRDSAVPVLGALCGLAWFLVFTLVWVRPVKALAGQTVTCTAVVETDADASYSESRLRGTLRLTEIDGRAANVKVQCASFPGESAGERFTAKFALTELPDNKYRLSRQSKGVYLQAEYPGQLPPTGRQPCAAVCAVSAAAALVGHTAPLAAAAAGRHRGCYAAGGQKPPG